MVSPVRVLGVLVASVFLASGCEAGPIVSEGVLESPCRSNADCDSGLCLVLPEYAMCTRRCIDATHTGCPSGYVCAPSDGVEVCFPSTAGACRGAELTCGSAFAPCCAGTVCVQWAEIPWACSRECFAGYECPTGCCASAGGSTRVCAPPSYCSTP